MIIGLRGALGVAATVLLAATTMAETKRVSGSVVGADGKDAANVDVASTWTITKDKLEPKQKIRTDRTGRFSGEVEVGKEDAIVMAVDKDRKNGAIAVVKAADLGKPIKLKLEPLAKLSGGADFSAFEKAPADFEFKLAPKGSKSSLISEKVKGTAFAYRLPIGEYTIELKAKDAEDYSDEIELVADKAGLDVGPIKIKPDQAYVKAQFGKPAKITVTDARGVPKDFKLESLKGKWVLIEFWGFW